MCSLDLKIAGLKIKTRKERLVSETPETRSLGLSANLYQDCEGLDPLTLFPEEEAPMSSLTPGPSHPISGPSGSLLHPAGAAALSCQGWHCGAQRTRAE